MIQISIFNELYHERRKENVKAVYPDGIHSTIAAFLNKEEDMTVRTFTQNEEGDCPELTEEALNETDVLFWWGHAMGRRKFFATLAAPYLLKNRKLHKEVCFFFIQLSF